MHWFLKFIFGILFQKQIWEISASIWFYYKNLSPERQNH